MRAPEFWWAPEDGGAAALLEPAAWVYQAIARRRAASVRPWRAGVPVLCVGNLVVGGAGKTPVAIDIAARLVARGASPHFLSRGYGGRLAGPVRVEPDRHTFAEVGDEPLLLADRAPTWVASDRAAGRPATA
ncbi:MAG: tetraacyldisaccharide 4'-kinase, partial [Rhodospirillales bacterium]|nr:tetraacyldisaccharide 4'-kinase [Rhodospirillales bacterium]